MTMRRRYFLYRPRNFDNEYTIYVVEENSDMQDRLVKMLDDMANDGTTYDRSYSRITREAAIRLGIREPRRAERQGEQHAGGLCLRHTHDPFSASDHEIIGLATEATEKAIEEWELQQRADEEGTA